RFKLQAHRGISHKYPENTLVSFKAASTAPCFWGIETDVQETSDGKIVVFHDEKLDDKTNGNGLIADYTFEYLDKNIFYNNNVNGLEQYPKERIPLFEEYLDICIDKQKVPYIELKHLSSSGIDTILGLLKAKKLNGKCVFSSFNWEYIEYLRGKSNEYPIEFMLRDKIYNAENIIKKLLTLPDIYFRPRVSTLTKDIVNAFNSAGVLVEGYGLAVGDNETLQNLKKWNVHGATCNDYEDLSL
ncbi:MAG: hypothetical protein LBL47_00070, partial [Lactobacillus sp.]|nr:hypothetical protein [Lactobacillus sp.]